MLTLLAACSLMNMHAATATATQRLCQQCWANNALTLTHTHREPFAQPMIGVACTAHSQRRANESEREQERSNGAIIALLAHCIAPNKRLWW